MIRSIFERRMNEAATATDGAHPATAAPVAETREGTISSDTVYRIKEQVVAQLGVNIAKVATDKIRDTIMTHVLSEAPSLPRNAKARLTNEILNDLIGLGPLQELLADPSVTEIMVNRYDQIYIEKDSRVVLANARFRDDKHVRNVIERIVAPVGRRIDESVPMVDARLPDGSRVNAIIQPTAMDGTCVTIRKFKKGLSMADLLRFGTLTPEQANILASFVSGKRNIIISGGTNTGKTSLLNCLSAYIDADERVITIEDAAELCLQQPHVIRLETRPPNVEGRGEITMRDLIANALRMRPDRIIVGECRRGEAFDMMQAMNTGHNGSMSTVHANTPNDAIKRLESMVLMAGLDLPVSVVRDYITSCIHVIVQVGRFPDGSRKITYISVIEGGKTRDVFRLTENDINEKGGDNSWAT